jgi:hypothetical protein
MRFTRLDELQSGSELGQCFLSVADLVQIYSTKTVRVSEMVSSPISMAVTV